MNKNIRYTGKTVFYSKETMFEFDGLFLNLYVDSEIYAKLTAKDCGNGILCAELQELYFDFLDCSINGSPKRVIFFFPKKISKCINQNFIFFTISLYVYDYFEYSNIASRPTNNNYIMTYYSKNLMKCLNLTPHYSAALEQDKANIAIVELNSDSCQKVSYSKIMGFDIEIRPMYKKKWNGCNFDFTPGLQLNIKNAVNINHNIQFKFYHAFIKLLKYIFMRDNIMPESMSFKYLNRQGTINSNCYANYEKEEENANGIYSSFIYWDSFYLVAGNLLKEIVEENILLGNIPDKKLNRIIVNNISISKDTAEFEYEFKKAYPQGVPYSKNRIEIEKKVKSELEYLKRKASGKEKDYYKQFIKHIKQESLKGNMQFAFKNHKQILAHLKARLNLNISFDEVSEECSKARNAVNHGKKGQKITAHTANCYVLLRMLIYSMQLKRVGLEEEKIKESIISLYKIKELGGLMV